MTEKQAGIPILLYHRIVPDIFDSRIECFRLMQIATRQASFEKQMLYLRAKYKVIGLRDLVSALNTHQILPDNTCVITFDDSYRDHYSYAFPILKRLGLVATFFIESGHTAESGRVRFLDRFFYALDHSSGKSFTLELPDGNRLDSQRLDPFSKLALLQNSGLKGWLKQKDEITQANVLTQLEDSLQARFDSRKVSRELYLSIEQMEEMVQGGMELGAHTIHHPSLLHIAFETARTEIFESGDFVKKINRTDTIAFAYPFGEGSNSPTLRRLVRDYGYYAACATLAGLNRWDTNPFELRRLTMVEGAF